MIFSSAGSAQSREHICCGVVFSLCLLVPTLSQASTYKGIGTESLPAETIKKFAPPDLDPSVREKIQNLLDVRSPGLGMLHPNKKSLFFTWRISGTTQVWSVDGPKSFPRQMTGGEHPTSIRDITPDGKFSILSRDRNGEENPGIYLQPVGGGPLQVVQHLPKVQTIFEFVTDDSKDIYFRSNQEDSSSFYFYRYSMADKKIEKVFGEKGYWYLADYQGSFVLLAKATTNTASEYFVFDLKTKVLTPLLGQGELVDYQVSFGTRPGQFIVTTNKFGDFKRVYFYQGKEFKPISPDEKFDYSHAIDAKRKRIFLSKNEGGYMRLSVMDARTLKSVPLPRFKDAENIFLGSITKDGETVVLGVETAKTPRTAYVYDFRSKKTTQWVVPSTPEVDLNQFIKAELIKIPTRDEKEIPAFARVPASCKDKLCPVVVHFHGGPEAQSLAGFDVLAQMFNEQGMIYVEPNVRGSDGYGKAYLDSDNGPKRLEVITDIADTAEYLKQRFDMNGKRPKIGVMGWSYGGYSTLYAMTKFAGSYDAGVALVGMSDLRTFLLNTAPYRRALRTPEYGDPEKDKEALKQLSPITFVDQVRDPLLVIQGVTDPRVPAGESVQIHERLKKMKIPTGLILFADEGHGTQKRSNQVLELGHTIAWFKTHLAEGEANRP